MIDDSASLVATLDIEELQCLLFLGLEKPERLRLALLGVVPPDGTSDRLALRGLCVQIPVDPATYTGEAGNFLARNADGSMALVELTARGRTALHALGSTRRVGIG